VIINYHIVLGNYTAVPRLICFVHVFQNMFPLVHMHSFAETDFAAPFEVFQIILDLQYYEFYLSTWQQ